MNVIKSLKYWKYPFILLFTIGVSNIGAWIYLIALNLNVLQMTGGSALAVAGLYVLKPIATLFTNTWSGSLIDRVNKRSIMISIDIFRAILIVLLPLFPSLWFIYLIVFILGMADSIFLPTSMTYITKLLTPDQRIRFNSFRSLISSGTFLVGPAVAGVLLVVGTHNFAIYCNALALFISGIVTLLLPNIEKHGIDNSQSEKLSLGLLRKDWSIVLNFSKKNYYIMAVYFMFSGLMVLSTALDSLEAAFSTEVLNLTERDYGFLVSVAGAGIVVGSIINTIFAKKLSISGMMGIGSVIVSFGYIIYAFSNTFFVAGIGFFVLAFALAFANTGFQTFYQSNIPVDIMGRVGSVYGLVEAFFIVVTTIIFGVIAEIVSIKFIVISGSLMMLLLTLSLCVLNMKPSKTHYYAELKKEQN
ncbi:MFS transporter [Peribacillus frigoritolerans]|uniref:MFS transporter n=1 Tax=Peribacillus frigoritolerans TaxID=450367 RepID=UPI002EB2316C|nr:MFS transporter [Peribacillus frigoritolerans]